jgi:cytoskeleton protein RodZ
MCKFVPFRQEKQRIIAEGAEAAEKLVHMQKILRALRVLCVKAIRLRIIRAVFFAARLFKTPKIDTVERSEYNAIALSKSDKQSRFLKLDPTESRHTAESQSAQPHSPPSKTPFGSDLKAARIEKEISLTQASKETRISLRYLQGLEEGQHGDLPGGMYNRAILRNYCVYLGLEPEEFLARFAAESAPHSEKAVKAKVHSQPAPEQPLRIPPLLIWSIMLLASITGLYFSRGWIAMVFSPYFSRPPAARLPVAAPAGTPNQAKETQAAAANPAAAVPADQTRGTEPAAPPVVAAQPPAEIPPGTIRLQFEVIQPCWMSLSGDGTRIYYDTLQPGQTLSFDAKDRFEMVLGNAGAIKLKINGKPAKPLGALGAVIKVLINAANIAELLEK